MTVECYVWQEYAARLKKGSSETVIENPHVEAVTTTDDDL